MEETNSAKSCCRDLKTGEEKILSLETTPGLVARLMGLESMPDVDFSCVKSRPNLVSRSQSMNSTDQFAAGFYCDDLKQQQGRHRRAKSTTEIKPEFVELGNEEFFILSFENASEGGKIRPKERKCEAGHGELRQRRTGRVKKPKNRMEKVAATTTTTITTKKKKKDDQEGNRTVLSDLNGKETLRSCSDKRTNKDGNNVKVKDSKTKTSSVPTKVSVVVVASEAVKSRKDKKRDKFLPSNGVKPNLNKNKSTNKTNSQTVKQVGPEFTSEDSSPVSVLECGQFLSDPQIPMPEEDCGSSTTTSSRRKLSLEIENYGRLCPRKDDDLMSEEEKHVGLSRKKLSDTGQECCYSQVLDEICKLSETELFGSSNWVQKWTLNHEDFQGIGEELESQILGQLLEEVVNQS